MCYLLTAKLIAESIQFSKEVVAKQPLLLTMIYIYNFKRMLKKKKKESTYWSKLSNSDNTYLLKASAKQRIGL